ncbi:hypothetical protein B0H14DRAFT_2626565 [Mycena olivaceomarginata]|nr:hypothetical protein B0H14DRAFT_2626565 [Mycena olivaceomarginata]
MADIVGLFASILQLVDTIAIARDYIKGFRDAPKDQQELLAEINNLAPLMKEVEERIKRAQSVRSGGGIQHFNEPLIQLDVVMRRLAKKLEPAGGVSRVSNRLTWPMWGKEDIQEGLRTIERFKSLLNAWLGIDILTSAQGKLYIRRYEQRAILTLLMPQRSSESTTVIDVVAVVTDATEEQRIDHKYISKSVREVARNQQIYHDSLERSKGPVYGSWTAIHSRNGNPIVPTLKTHK